MLPREGVRRYLNTPGCFRTICCPSLYLVRFTRSCNQQENKRQRPGIAPSAFGLSVENKSRKLNYNGVISRSTSITTDCKITTFLMSPLHSGDTVVLASRLNTAVNIVECRLCCLRDDSGLWYEDTVRVACFMTLCIKLVLPHVSEHNDKQAASRTIKQVLTWLDL